MNYNCSVVLSTMGEDIALYLILVPKVVQTAEEDANEDVEMDAVLRKAKRKRFD